MRNFIIVAIVTMAFLGGMTAHAQLSSWGWWGTSQTTMVPISASNPLPVRCL